MILNTNVEGGLKPLTEVPNVYGNFFLILPLALRKLLES